MWSSLDWATPGIFHRTKTQLDVLDGVQRRFLSFVGLSPSEAFLSHNLGPLSLRRSIAMLGFIYKCVRGLAPVLCCSMFTLDHRRNQNLRSNDRLHKFQLVDPVGVSASPLLRRSIYSLVTFWNHLPKDVITAPSVKSFQSRITDLAKQAVSKGCRMNDLCALNFIYVRYGVENQS